MAFSRERSLSAPELRRWGRTFADSETATAIPSPVMMAKVVTYEGGERAPLRPTEVCLIVEVAGARVVVPPGFDAGSLTQVVSVLETRGGRR